MFAGLQIELGPFKIVDGRIVTFIHFHATEEWCVEVVKRICDETNATTPEQATS